MLSLSLFFCRSARQPGKASDGRAGLFRELLPVCCAEGLGGCLRKMIPCEGEMWLLDDGVLPDPQRLGGEAREASFRTGSRFGQLYFGWVFLPRYIVWIGVVMVFLNAAGFLDTRFSENLSISERRVKNSVLPSSDHPSSAR